MTPRQAKLVEAHDACLSAAREIELHFPASELSDPMTPKGRREIVNMRHRDVAALKLAGNTAMAVAEDPEAYAAMVSLRTKNVSAFNAIANLARQELERADAPAEVAA